MFSETEYEFKSYIDPYFIETRVMWSMAFQAMHEQQGVPVYGIINHKSCLSALSKQIKDPRL